MDMDFMSCGPGEYRSVRHNWTGWRTAFELALAYGWEPRGILPPPGLEDGWTETYFSNDFQEVTATDAAALADALERAIGAGAEELMDSDVGFCNSSAVKDRFQEFVGLCRQGGFYIGESRPQPCGHAAVLAPM